MKKLVLLLIVSMCSVSMCSVSVGAKTPSGAPAKTTQINIFLVALNDDGYTGKRIGCGDSLVKEPRTIAPTDRPLQAAIEEMLSVQ